MTHSKRIIATLFLVVFAIFGVLMLITGYIASDVVISTLKPDELTLTRSAPTATPKLSKVALSNTPTPTPDPTATSTSRPSPTPSNTPTTRPTHTPTATPTPSLTPTPFHMDPPALIGVTPTLSDTTAVPSPVPTIAIAPGAINVVVLGSDRRPDWDVWHTDVVQIVSIQPSIPVVTVLSIPRDLYVYIPDFWMSRVNFADMYGELYNYEGGGPALVQQTLLYNLGIPVDHYVRTDFDGLIGIVDALGGVDIPVHCRLQDYWPYPDENGEYHIKVLEPGVHHMDGQTALWYARSRKTSSVFARERRQQQVLKAIWHKGRRMDVLPRLPQLWEQIRGMVVTDMTFNDILMLAEVAFRLDEQNVRFRNIGYQQVTPWTTPKGGAVFLPNWPEIEPVVSEAMGPVPEGRLWRTLQTVEVWNGTPNADWDHLAADRLFREGFIATIGEPDRRDYPHTQLIDFTGATKGNAMPHLQRMFGVYGENAISTLDPNAPAQYRLIIGANYQTCSRP